MVRALWAKRGAGATTTRRMQQLTFRLALQLRWHVMTQPVLNVTPRPRFSRPFNLSVTTTSGPPGDEGRVLGRRAE
ncbi:MAG: hypothetical protein CM15mP77_1970 [Synechococcus sp.]|nr:MAG: hypothetical protein CM15mP77_1970 [Synechococcus sp.]